MKIEQPYRALAALEGLALGDALGMPTQSMSAECIAQAYTGVHGLVDAVNDQPIAPGMKAGHVTDDTEQTLIVADLLTDNDGHIDPYDFAERLLSWEDNMKARGSLDLLGPSTKLALEQVRSGADANTTGKTGTTNGAAMRVSPVGISHDATHMDFADLVYESCRVTHNTTPGFQSALLVAATVSFGINGMNTHDALHASIKLAEQTKPRGAWSPKASVLARVKLSIAAAQHEEEATPSATGRTDSSAFAEMLRNQFGSSVEANESVPVAFALAWRYANNPIQALLAAANIGGDTDTIASICGAMMGATNGLNAFPRSMIDTVAQVSNLNLGPTAKALFSIRTHEALQ